MKNKTKKALCAASILGVVAISGIFAYLTDTESKENVFTIGNVDIELHEPGWDIIEDDPETTDVNESNDQNENGIPDFAENLVPNQEIPKAPSVENVGANDAYVFLRLQFKGDLENLVDCANIDGTVPCSSTGMPFMPVASGVELRNDSLFYAELDSRGWMPLLSTSIGTVDEEGNFWQVLTFAYKDELESGETTPALFDSIIVCNATEAASGLEGCIKVEAFAIQSKGLPADIAEDIEALEDIDSEDLMEQSEDYEAFDEAMGNVYNIIMNQNPDAQLTPYVPEP